MATNIKISETLMLRRIDPVNLLNRYLAGDFSNVKIPNDKIDISSNFINLNQRIGNDQTSKIYRFNDKSNCGQTVVTTNHNQYNYVKNTMENKNPIKSTTWCLWSKRKIEGTPIGIPIVMEIDKQNKVTFQTEDTYANFGCALAGLKRLYSCHRNYKDPLYMDAEQLLHCMYYRMYPDKLGTRIVEAKDWRLLDINGGPLTEEEYDSDQYGYIPIPNVVTIPIKRQYIKLALTKTK